MKGENGVTIRHLRVFQAVCEEGSVTKAAKRLYMTQPAVSHVIHELESGLGIQLFDRVSRRIDLNQTGERFLQKAVRILELYDELEMGAFLLERQAPLRLGSSITIANFWLPALLKKMASVCPVTPVQVTIERANEVLQKLHDNKLDAALVEGPVLQDTFLTFRFSAYRLVVVCPPGHPLAQQEETSVQELVREPFLLREKGSAIRDTFDSALLLHGLSVEPIWTSVNSPALMEGVKNGFGLSVMPEDLIQKELKQGALQMVNVPGLSLQNENHLALHKNKYQSEPLRALIQIVKELEHQDA